MYVHVKPNQPCPICGKRAPMGKRNIPRRYCSHAHQREGNRRRARERFHELSKAEREDIRVYHRLLRKIGKVPA